MSRPKPRPRSLPPRALEQCTTREHGSPLLAGIAAFGAHGLLCLALIALGGAAPSQAALSSTPLYEVELAPPPAAPEPPPAAPEPPPPPPPVLKQPKSAPEPVRAPEPQPPPEETEPEPPAPAAAQAAEAVTATEEAASPADTLVTGGGPSFAGGTTERGGTATHAVQSPNARALGVEGGTGTAALDRTRPPQLASGSNWDCPLPEEAAEEGVDQATVALVVDVATDGKVLSVEVKQDPGYGFGREARACAFKKRWLPGVDRSGQPARGKLPVNVRFVAH